MTRSRPRPERLLEAGTIEGLGERKTEQLRAVAQAALDGRLDPERLRSIEPEEALAERWLPFRTWATVLLRFAWERT